MFPRNTWYVARTPDEIDARPLGRKLMLNIDAGGVQSRKILERIMAEEQAAGA